MKKFLAILLSALMLMTLLAACGTSNEPSGESAAPASEAPESETPAEPVELTVWHDNDEALMQAMADAANAKLEGTGVTLTFEKRTGLSDQLKLYGARRNTAWASATRAGAGPRDTSSPPPATAS